MNIKFLKKLENSLNINGTKMKGVSLEEITKAELQLSISFQKSIKEYLFLAGEQPSGLRLFPGNSSFSWMTDSEVVDYKNSVFKEFEVLQHRPVWVFTEMDGFEQFLFVYLDEKCDDPEVFQAELTNVTKIWSREKSFSKFIDELIDYSILYLKRGY